MVLESMLNPKNAEDKPWHVFVIAFVYSLLSMVFAYIIFPGEASLLSVAFITIVFVPFFQKLFSIEERAEDFAADHRTGKNLWSRHSRVILVFSSFFLGVIVAMSFVFTFFPHDSLFSLQSDTLRGMTGAATYDGNFSRFFVNNTQVMIMIFIMSLIFGAGSVFILAWNASVISVFVGSAVRSAAAQGYDIYTAYLIGVPGGLASIAMHGVPEIAAYFIAGLGGGIMSVGLIREKFGSRHFKVIVVDSARFLIFAEALIFVAALIEAA